MQTFFVYGPLFLFAEDAIASRTSRLADTIASDDMLAESDPLARHLSKSVYMCYQTYHNSNNFSALIIGGKKYSSKIFSHT